MTKRTTNVLLGLNFLAFMILVVVYAYKHADQSMATCVSGCMARCAR